MWVRTGLSGVTELSRVLRTPGGPVDDTVPLERVATVRELMCHNAGFSYGFLQESTVDALYAESGVIDPRSTLAAMRARRSQAAQHIKLDDVCTSARERNSHIPAAG